MSTQAITNAPLPKPYIGSLRLPAYRFTHLGRYHPYGRKTPYQAGAASNFDPMQTHDHRFDDNGRPSLVLSVIDEEDEAGNHMEQGLVFESPITTEHLVIVSADPERATGFMEIVIDFAFAMRRRMRRLASKRA